MSTDPWGGGKKDGARRAGPGHKSGPAHKGRKNPRTGPRGARGKPPPTAAVSDLLELLLTELLTFERPSDVVMSDFFRRHRNLGRHDRGQLAQRVFAVLRNRRLYAHLAESGAGAQARRMALIADRDQPQPMLSPRGAEGQWLQHIATIDRSQLAPAVRFSLPDWLYEAVNAQPVAGGFETMATALLEPAALDIRANLLKTDPDKLRSSLASQGIEASPVTALPGADSGTALRLKGHPALEKLDIFAAGHFEVQDAGSQWVVARSGARRGQTVIDFCAGAGGKTLALAAQMRSSGQIYACDTSLRRLARLKPRLARCGATNIQTLALETETDPKLDKLRGLADLVLIDAPCSGTGTARRNPDLKWRQSPESVARLVILQLSILNAATALVKPGGRLVYVTCSLLAAENEEVAAAFEGGPALQAAGLVRVDLAQSGPDLADAAVGDTGFLRLWPHLHGTDGFFMAAWQRPKQT